MTQLPQSFLPYGKQQIDEDDIKAVADVLRSDYLTCGPTVEAFEIAFARKVGAPHAVVCSNGTAALHLAALALGLGPGDVVIVPSVTFLATASSPHFTGADIVFADVDPNTGLMTAATFQDALDRAHGPVKAVFPVHLNGGCVDLDAINAIAKPLGITVVDDACHALGATMNGEKIGSGKKSAMSVYSMHPVKTIAMGEGGAVTTADDELAAKLRAYRNHGMHRDIDAFVQPDEAFDAHGNASPWYYEMPHPGLNYRQSDIHCALGLSQLKKLDGFLNKRRALADAYDVLLAPMAPALRPISRVPGCEGGWHLYPVLIDFDAIGKPRAQVMQELRALNIGTQVHYLPVHRQPYWRARQSNLTLPGADAYYARCLSLPLFPDMDHDDLQRVVSALEKAL